LYVAGAYVCFWQLAGAGACGSIPVWEAIVAVFLSATAVYAIDRVKLSDRLLDPADIAAQPVRYAFLTRYTYSIRIGVMVVLLVAMGLASVVSQLLAVVIGLSVLGVLLYAPGPRRSLPRPKDLLGVKNFLVAAGVVSLAIAATALFGPLSEAGDQRFWAVARQRVVPVSEATILLLLRVMIDAAICDVDDMQTDRRHGTQTLATLMGASGALTVLYVARIAAAGLIILLANTAMSVRIAWAGAGVLSAVVLYLRRGKPVRDPVDVAMGVEAIIVTLLLTAIC
jgi:4-hydroxybenzoate polyprenyltransferase